jgi:ribosomal protein S18 acetylase RimI-like enzyme
MPSQGAVRRIRADEAVALRGVRLAALAADPDAFGSTYEREVAFEAEVWETRAREGANDAETATFVADGEAGLVGIVTVRLESDEPGRAHVYGLWVAPASRGSGLGSALTQAVVDWAGGRGAAEVVLLVVVSNAAAIALYRRLGFVDSGLRKTLGRDPTVEEIEMIRPLG